jgi:hypothetical protein
MLAPELDAGLSAGLLPPPPHPAAMTATRRDGAAERGPADHPTLFVQPEHIGARRAGKNADVPCVRSKTAGAVLGILVIKGSAV